jgi:hypothetical protein
MTFIPSALFRLGSLSLAMVVPSLATAWQATPPPRPVLVVLPPTNARFQQSVREQQAQDQLHKNQLEEQLRQTQANAVRRPFAANPAQASRLDQADQSQRELYRARQQDLLDRYRSAVAPPVVHAGEAPASSRSSD